MCAAFVLAAALSGCANYGAGAGAAGQPAGAAAPVVNSAIYSNDYIIDEGPVKGGGIRIYATTPDTYNPLVTANMYASAMFSLVYESLAKFGPEMEAEKWLAEDWAPSEDGMSWYITLRDGVKWHDGRLFGAYDVIMTINRIKSYGDRSPYAGLVSNIESATAESPLLVRLNLKRENSYTPHTLIFPIAPAHIVIDGMDGEGGDTNLRSALIGTGPYRYRGYERGASLLLTIADGWWRAEGAVGDARRPEDTADDAQRSEGAALDVQRSDGAALDMQRSDGAELDVQRSDGAALDMQRSEGATYNAQTPEGAAVAIATPPYIRDVNFIFSDPSVTSLSQFRANNVDLFFSRSFNSDMYRHSSEMLIRGYAERDFLFVALNNEKGATAAKNNRRALARMVDRQALIDEALKGRGVPAEFPVCPESALYGRAITNTPHDPQAARSILESEGFRMDEGYFYGDIGSGWNKFDLTLLVNEEDNIKLDIAGALSAAFSDCGVNLIVAPEPADEVARKVSEGDFEAALLSYRTPPFPDMTELYSSPWSTSEIVNDNIGEDGEEGENAGADDEENMDGSAGAANGSAVTANGNPARYTNGEAARLAGELFTVYDENDRDTAFAELIAILQDDAPYIGLCFQSSSLVYGDDLFGEIRPNAWNPLNGLPFWYIADYR